MPYDTYTLNRYMCPAPVHRAYRLWEMQQINIKDELKLSDLQCTLYTCSSDGPFHVRAFRRAGLFTGALHARAYVHVRRRTMSNLKACTNCGTSTIAY